MPITMLGGSQGEGPLLCRQETRQMSVVGPAFGVPGGEATGAEMRIVRGIE